MKSIILPTDFSVNAQNALEFAISNFKGNDTEFILLNAFNPPHPTGMLINIEDLLKKESVNELEKTKKELEKKAGKENLHITTVAKLGTLTEAIEVAAKQYNAYLVVMGTKGASGLKGIFVGSNTSEIVKSAILPTLAVPEDTKALPAKKIVLAADYEHLDDLKCLEPLKELAKRMKSTLLIVNVETDHSGGMKFNPVIEKLSINDFLKDVPHSFHFVKNKDVVAGLNDFVLENKADMLAMIPGRNNFFDSIFHKSVTNKMVLNTQIPLLSLLS